LPTSAYRASVPETSGGFPVSEPDISPELKEVIEVTAKTVLQRLLVQRLAADQSGSRLLTVKQTCVCLNCARSTLIRLEEKGVLVPKRFGRKVLYDRADLDAYIQKAGVA
jgi:excisionase family DNA binding protein